MRAEAPPKPDPRDDEDAIIEALARLIAAGAVRELQTQNQKPKLATSAGE